MSTPEWKAFLNETVFVKSYGRVELDVRFERYASLETADHWDWKIIDYENKRMYPNVLLDGEACTKEEAMLAAENAAKELAQALMPLLGEEG